MPPVSSGSSESIPKGPPPAQTTPGKRKAIKQSRRRRASPERRFLSVAGGAEPAGILFRVINFVSQS
jgi:hypothetical protein